MKIREFKFNKQLVVPIYISKVLDIANIFGFPYIIKYIVFIIEDLKGFDETQKQLIIQKLNLLYMNKQLKYWRNDVLANEIWKIIDKMERSLSNSFTFYYLGEFLTKLSESKMLFIPRFYMNIVETSNEFTLKQLESLDFNKIELYLFKKFNYIYIKDKSFWGTNWYSFELNTRGKDQIKYVIPFYRTISRDMINYHIALELGLFSDETVNKVTQYPAYYYMPPAEWDPAAKEIVIQIRQRLQRNKLFNIKNNYQTINNIYYIYKNRLIDIDFNLYKLNRKWLQEAKIIKASTKK